MSVELVPVEGDCFNFTWKIKNFSYCSELISSPLFKCNELLCSLDINPKFVKCQLNVLSDVSTVPRMPYRLSILPCDDYPPITFHSRCLQVSKEILFKTLRSSFLPDDTLTVHFKFPTFSQRGRLFVQSQIGVKRKCFVWKMKNFINDQHFRNDFEKIAHNSDRFGLLSLRLKSVDGINSDELFYIEISLDQGEKCSCVLEVSVLNIDGKAVNCVNGEFHFKAECAEQKRKFPPFIKKSKLLACKDRLMPDGTLSLKCNFAITMGTITDETAVLNYCKDVTPLLKESQDLLKCFKDESGSDSATGLKSDLEKILENKTFSDVKLIVCTQEFNVHKNILGARSPVFESMFMGATGENNNTFVIEDLDKNTLHSLLLYMYTDTIRDSNWKNIKKLYSAAEKFRVQSLKQKCSSLLKSKFAVSNISEALILADSHEDADLETAALDFIYKHDSEVFASKKWKDVEKNHCSLALRALRHTCLQK